jgi:hypothetical protein
MQETTCLIQEGFKCNPDAFKLSKTLVSAGFISSMEGEISYTYSSTILKHMSKDQEEFFNQAAAPGLEHWKKSFSKGFNSGQYDSEVGFEQRFQNWMLQGGMNRLMTENCFVKCLIGAFGGGALGLGFGAFLAPFDGRSGMRVSSSLRVENLK